MRVKPTYSIREYGYLLEEPTNNDQPIQTYKEELVAQPIPRSAFRYLLSFIKNDDEKDFAPFLRLTTFKRTTALKVQNYVGVLQTPCGTQIEVLPKVFNDDIEPAEKTRKTLITMLRCLRDSPFKQGDSAEIRTTNMPLLEVYISQFLSLTNQLIKRGIRSDYVRVQNNSKFLRGRLLVSQQIRSNMLHPERFAIEYDEYLVNRPANRLIKATLALVTRVAQSSKNQRLARGLSFAFEDVPKSTDIRTDFQKVKTDRSMSYYQNVLEWCRLLLNGHGPTSSTGGFNTLSILYPMERIFEDYVAHRLRPKLGSYFEGCTLKTQAATDSLVENHNDKPIFKLKPDLLIIKGVETVCVMDTKWKLLDASNHLNKYGISQADMYQLYAYGHKYLKKSKPPKKLMLVYPKTDKFEKRLPLFEYEKGEKGLKLDVVPFDLNEGVLIDERYPSGS
jgi:5-methylcytosine-specific restriction enzyme subunit McrC